MKQEDFQRFLNMCSLHGHVGPVRKSETLTQRSLRFFFLKNDRGRGLTIKIYSFSGSLRVYLSIYRVYITLCISIIDTLFMILWTY